MRVLRTVVCAAVSGGMALSLMHSTGADAEMVATRALIPDAPAERRTNEERLAVCLEQLGVDPRAARMRVAALTPREKMELAMESGPLPSGGDVVSLLAFSALVLLLTDILGYTDVYSFVTRTINGEKQAKSHPKECAPDATSSAKR